MATISGKLINGIGEPIKNCKITLKSISTSTTVIAHTTASQTPSAAGDYSMSVEPGKYKVTLGVDGFPPEYVGDIQIYKDSPNGTLNYFLGLPQDDDLRPDAIKHFEAMVDKVASQVAEVEKSKLAAEASARSAAASADRASQITGLSTVTDAISMASVPLPDVWIPLNDSLQMLTGYGDEVKVGDIVVAKMVTFTRASTASYINKANNIKTASVNEPRFETDGLLVEGQSNNLVEHSSFKGNLNAWSTPNPTGNEYSYVSAPDGTNEALDAFFVGDGINRYIASLKVGAKYTLSFWARNITNDEYRFLIRIGSGNVYGDILKIPPNSGWNRYFFTQSFYEGDNVLRLYSNTRSQHIQIWGVQLEEGDSMTSYVATYGSQITKSGDICYIEKSPNIPGVNKDITIAFNSDIIKTNNSSTPSIFSISVDKFQPTKEQLRATIEPDKSVTLWSGARHGFSKDKIKQSNTIVLSVRGDESVVMLNGELRKLQRTYDIKGIAISFQTGHIRNVRIWHKALTDEQMKAIQ
ncbi:Prophage tail fibre N-terminal [Edwardsiella tarda]|uniref:Prophage tail fiber N-terminal domain-containing protein n=1 Tax=Edwardsiella tarda ATCC 15947 = NBRC 105688 TaxID=667121 RepID=A0AC61TG01_EDWTA|nr:prophage tail fiber N-terminal domain-containing protein [Edwardsiella tarda]UAL57496.1 prophage tail fiber N-terminal domain-containing protein [Edwardsiella tarda]UCP99443.1 prophage tail fiber N-terminal domain-containing protein [Edwardsiella tarda ATCC 15947 = NBRC 105688]STD30320.1 Prophage tail fibre N-terminal [Edwardsiella tarda]